MTMENCCAEEAWPEAEKAIEAEFQILGLAIEYVAGNAVDERGRREEIQEAAEELNAMCALRIVRVPENRRGGIDLWINDRLTGKTLFRHLNLDVVAEPDAAEIAGLKIVESLRASLLELKLPGESKQKDEPPAEIVEIVAAEPPALTKNRLALGGAGWGSPGGVLVIGGVQVSYARFVHPHLTLEVDAAVSVLGRDISNDIADGSLYLAALRIWSLWRILAEGLFRPAIGAGLGGVVFWGKGSSSDPGYAPESDAGIVSYLGANAELGLAFARNLGLRLGARVGLLLPEVEINFAADRVALVGMPLIEGYLNFGIEF